MRSKRTNRPRCGYSDLNPVRLAQAAKLSVCLTELTHGALMEIFPDEMTAISCLNSGELAEILADGLEITARDERDSDEIPF